MSHEIRTPLNGIMGPVRLLKDKLEDTDLSNLVNILNISVARLEKFAYTALKITELRTEQYQLELNDQSLKQIIENSIKVHSERFSKKNLQVISDEIPEDLMVFCKLELLNIAFKNILDNAIKYSEKNGKIFIKIKHSKTKITCQIIDQGKGFSKKALENLFKFFSPGEKYFDKTLGLDLALTNLIMEVHSGKMEVGNMKSGGAVVKLTFFRNI